MKEIRLFKLKNYINVYYKHFTSVNMEKLNVAFFFFFLNCSVMKSHKADQSLVDYYINLINEKTQWAPKYQFPRDARVYEPKYSTLQGKLFEIIKF